MKNLVIVESPAKAKTIEKFLGPDFFVTSSRGHIRDLASGNNAIDVKNGFKPVYEVSDDKRTLVNDLKKLVSKAETIWLATDEDREGEAISWHLFDELKLNESNTKRIVFNEITKPAILNAVAHPRTIDKYLVDAQQARRVLDRLVGFELSPVLWRRVRPSLSAGRVQSVAVRLVVEREREINDFTSNSEFRITCIFKNLAGKSMKAELWLRHGGENLDISPPNFHHALATWLANAGLVHKDKAQDVAAVLYCLGVTNSNNLFQKVNQGKLVPLGIGKNGRRNAKGQRKA